MSGKKPEKAKQIRDQDENANSANSPKGGSDRLPQEKTLPLIVRKNPVDEANAATLKRVREVPRPRLVLCLSLTYVVWLALLAWLAVSIS